MNTSNEWNLLKLNTLIRKQKYDNKFIYYHLINFNDKTIKNIVNLSILIKDLNLDCDLILGIEITDYKL
jgi:hypothetical protein